MRLLFTCLTLCFFNAFYSQNYNAIDQKIESYPHSFDKPEKLAVLINNDFSSKSDKSRAIYAWICKNVKYDLSLVKTYASGTIFHYKTEQERIAKEKKFKSDMSLLAIRENKAMCYGYALLYERLCNLTDIESVTVTGALKSDYEEIGKLPGEYDHAWNLVKIDSQWKFIDATLGAGSLSGPNGEFVADYNDGFFFTSPEMFFLNHYPKDEKWLMIKKTKEDFAALPLYYRDYFKGQYKITSPLKGNLQLTSNEVAFKFDNVGPYFLAAYFTDKTNKLMVLYQNEDAPDYIGEVDRKNDNYINIVVDKKMIATYRIK